MRQKYAAAPSDRVERTRDGRDLLRRYQFYQSQPASPRRPAAALRRALSERRIVEFDDAGGEYRPAARRIYRSYAGADSRGRRTQARTGRTQGFRGLLPERDQWRHAETGRA